MTQKVNNATVLYELSMGKSMYKKVTPEGVTDFMIISLRHWETNNFLCGNLERTPDFFFALHMIVRHLLMLKEKGYLQDG